MCEEWDTFCPLKEVEESGMLGRSGEGGHQSLAEGEG